MTACSAASAYHDATHTRRPAHTDHLIRAYAIGQLTPQRIAPNGGYRALSALAAVAECDHAGAAASRLGVSSRKSKPLLAARLRATTFIAT
jgi:hypothetical protein